MIGIVLGKIYDPDTDCWYLITRVSSKEMEQYEIDNDSFK